jgi:hypothetical protein
MTRSLKESSKLPISGMQRFEVLEINALILPALVPGFALSTLIAMSVLDSLAWFSKEAGAFELDIY